MFFNKKRPKKSEDQKKITEREAISALQVAYDTGDVKKADPIFEGETALIVDDTNFVTLFDSDEEFKSFYNNALGNSIFDTPEASIAVFDRYLGKNKWTDYVPRNRMVKALTTIIEKTRGKIDDDLREKIESQPFSLLRSFFNMSSMSDRKEFYSFVLANNNGELVEDAVEAIFKSVKSKTVYFPVSDCYLKAYDWGKP